MCADLIDHLPDGGDLGSQLSVGRVGVVAFQHDACQRGPLSEGGEDVKDLLADRVGVGVVPDPVAEDPACDVDVADLIEGEGLEGGNRVQSEVDLRGVEVGDVEQEQDTSALDERGEELRLGELVLWPADQDGDVLHGERDREYLLGGADVLGEDA